jgi:hypothetical protein
MNNAFLLGVQEFFKTVSEILVAGIAITAFSLLLFALYYNIKDRVIRSFLLILISVVIVFTTESFARVAAQAWEIELWLKLQWVGIVVLPAMYFHFSDALLATTGKPSRWKRKWLIRCIYLISIGFLVLIPLKLLVGNVVTNQPPAAYLQPTIWTTVFVIYYLIFMVLTWVNFLRTYKRAATAASKRRMAYLLIGATAPAIGSFPFLLFSTNLASQHTLLFWIVNAISNLLVGGLLVIMAYAVSFFGVAWPDRVIKSRLSQWLMRGPFTASSALAVTTIVHRVGQSYGTEYSGWVPISMVATVVLLEYLITLVGPFIQRWLFYGNDQEDLELLETIENGLLTRGDLRQFLEMILTAVCDHLQVKGAYILSLEKDQTEFVTEVGKPSTDQPRLNGELIQIAKQDDGNGEPCKVGINLCFPLKNGKTNGDSQLLGFMVIREIPNDAILKEHEKEINLLTSRAGLALRDRILQEQVFQSLERLTPQVGLIQQLRAAGRYNRNGILEGDEVAIQANLGQWIKDALDHYWGGPKLTENPLVKLKIVQNLLPQHEDKPSNALRSILKECIEKIKPEGERKYTSEWILYNLLDLKFMEGKKVREIARKLSISEADLYRKQRVALHEVGKILLEMESQVGQQGKQD